MASKTIIKFLLGLGAVSSTIISCGSDDSKNENIATPQLVTIDPSNFKGELKSGQQAKLDPSKVYKLTGGFTIRDGASLEIPAGTRIEATGGTSSYLAVAQGGKIFVNGTASAPVVFTSGNTTPAGGDWGGLVLCGRAPINVGNGTATSEVASLTYGGTSVSDNSGSIKYCRIEYSGAAFNSEKEFNGLSLFGVGNGTTIDYVQIYQGNDDGIEFFGGTVNAYHIVSNGNEDDAFDYTEGWTGTSEYIYTTRRTDGTGNRGVEADNSQVNELAAPVSNPTIKNATFIGATAGSESQALKLRYGTKGSFENIVVSGFSTGVDIEHDSTLDNVATGSLKITKIKFDNITTESSGKKSDKTVVNVTNAYTVDNTATGAGNGTAIPTWAQGWTANL
ncbi:hypothetical protein O2K51_03855 [Apibacter raozihei]|uniref:hypothetical protein n=1 Tax=Apibacter raozihei TaxID=2500547 RepID=UPI000FE2E7C5|nr:hypothetical protein [Apibacter raozihei]